MQVDTENVCRLSAQLQPILRSASISFHHERLGQQQCRILEGGIHHSFGVGGLDRRHGERIANPHLVPNLAAPNRDL